MILFSVQRYTWHSPTHLVFLLPPPSVKGRRPIFIFLPPFPGRYASYFWQSELRFLCVSLDEQTTSPWTWQSINRAMNNVPLKKSTLNALIEFEAIEVGLRSASRHVPYTNIKWFRSFVLVDFLQMIHCLAAAAYCSHSGVQTQKQWWDTYLYL